MRVLFSVLIICLLVASPVMADTIYIWTDENGVKRFSDQRPEGVEDYDTATSSTSDDSGEEVKNDTRRPGLEKMIEDVEKENRLADERKAAERARMEKEKVEKEKAEKDSKNAAERARLQKKIDEINNRALSPTFTQGMRDNQINEIRKKMQELE